MDKRAIDLDELILQFKNLSLDGSNRVTRTSVSSAAVASASAPAPSLAAVATASASTSLANNMNRLKSAIYATSSLSTSSIYSNGASTIETLASGSWASMLDVHKKSQSIYVLAQNGVAYLISSLGNAIFQGMYYYIYL